MRYQDTLALQKRHLATESKAKSNVCNSRSAAKFTLCGFLNKYFRQNLMAKKRFSRVVPLLWNSVLAGFQRTGAFCLY